jgi:hypothetical protein
MWSVQPQPRNPIDDLEMIGAEMREIQRSGAPVQWPALQGQGCGRDPQKVALSAGQARQNRQLLQTPYLKPDNLAGYDDSPLHSLLSSLKAAFWPFTPTPLNMSIIIT